VRLLKHMPHAGTFGLADWVLSRTAELEVSTDISAGQLAFEQCFPTENIVMAAAKRIVLNGFRALS
jgi:hypothetical protein